MRVLVCGGRDFGDIKRKIINVEQAKAEYNFVRKTLEEILCPPCSDDNPFGLPTDLTIISGGARGVDSIAINFAVVNLTGLAEYKPDWDKYKKAAGPIRNQQMIDEGKPDLVIAFPGGRGTADMVSRARKAGIEVKEINYV